MKDNLYDTIPIPEQLDEAVKKGIWKGKQRKRYKRYKKWLAIGSSMAAMLILSLTVCMVNPALASQIPVLGKIFIKIESHADAPGNFSERAVNLYTSSEEQTEQQLLEQYGDTQLGISIIPEEVFCDGASLYISMRLITSDEAGFGQEAIKEFIEDERISSFYRMQVTGSIYQDEFTESFDVWMNGEPESSNTFIGMIKIPAEELKSQGDVRIDISRIYWTDWNKKVEAEKRQETGISSYYMIREGNWSLTLPVTVDTSLTKSFPVHKTNEQGIGIDTITITPYEIQIQGIYPPDAHGGFAVFNGTGERIDYLEYSGEAEVHVVNGKNTDELYFYYMNDGIEALKCQAQAIAEEKAEFSYQLSVKK